MANNTETLLIELGCEELPAKLTPQLADKLAQQLDHQLQAHHLAFESVQWLATPRRIGLLVNDLVKKQADQQHKRQGPKQAAAFKKDGSPTPAAIGFAKSCDVTVDALAIEDGRLVHQQHCPGKATTTLLPELIQQAMAYPAGIKAMQWGKDNAYTFLRPVRWAVVLFGKQVVKMDLFGCSTSAMTHGHRFHAHSPFKIKHPNSYIGQLEKQGHVVADAAARCEAIRQQLLAAAPKDANVVIDRHLLEEVTYLVEWPVVLRCQFEDEYLSLPNELLVSVLHHHQKCFHTVSKKNRNKLTPTFLPVSNLNSKDTARVIDGNQRVVRARLDDALFCFNNDTQKTLSEHGQALEKIVFQHKLGSLGDKVKRVSKLATHIAKQIDADIAETKQAADLCKADLCSETVGEFPEFAGILGHALAKNEKLPKSVCVAIRDYARPRSAQDAVAKDPVACAVAIADKIDTLVGLFGIKQPPTGEKDPFALRRAALGVIRTILDNQLNLPLEPLLETAASNAGKLLNNPEVVTQTLQFILDRLGAWYADQGIDISVFKAVTACNLSDCLDIDQRLRALQKFSKQPAAASLIAANKRVSQLLKKADKTPGNPNAKLYEADAEKALANALTAMSKTLAPHLKARNYHAALTELASLQAPINAFFDHVMVMTEDTKLRNNRLALLHKLQQTFNKIADISYL